jgi:glycosyltransferase involved in cell wall biosynthesis
MDNHFYKHCAQHKAMAKNNVSLLTCTQGSRIPFMEIEKQVVMCQTYNKIIEWVIVDGSKNADDSAKLQAYLDTWTDFKYCIVRVQYKEGRKLGGHRNAGNRATQGDIIVWLDDDDYYQAEYVSHAVFMLNRSKQTLAGCGPMFIYDLYWRMLTQNDLMGPYATVNNCLCYRREYLKNHSYDEEKVSNEEPSFTDTFKAAGTNGSHEMRGSNEPREQYGRKTRIHDGAVFQYKKWLEYCQEKRERPGAETVSKAVRGCYWR